MSDKDEQRPEEKPASPKGHRDGVSKAEGREEKPTPKDSLIVTSNMVWHEYK